ncbi:MAG: hypothetical protein LAP38_28230 [Acidobacteriia bacterium]|nr:hypothetical protein [Terriglobia bacterium]
MGLIYSDKPRHGLGLVPRTMWLLLAAFLMAAALSVWPQPGRTPSVVHAATCDATSLNGTYGYTFSGFFFDSSGNLNVFSSSGSFNADGQGNLSGTETDAFSGTIVRAATYTGTYTVNSDCSGSYTTNSDMVGGPFVYDFVITDGGNGVQVVEADDGTNITGTARKQ